MSLPNRILFALTFTLLGSTLAFGQSNDDTIVIRYLRTKPDVPPPFLKVVRHGNKVIRNQNYFIDRNDPIDQDTVKIHTLMFGSGASHARKFFLIKILLPHSRSSKIIDSSSLEEAISILFDTIAPYHLITSNKAQLVNQLTFTYY